MDVFDPSNAQVVVTVRTDGTIADMGYTADGRRLLVAAGRSIDVLDAQTLQQVAEPIKLDAWIGSVDPSPDGRFAFITVSPRPWTWHEQALVHRGALVDLDTGDVVHSGQLPIDSVAFAAFSPRGSQVAAVGISGELLLFDTDTWRPVAPTARPNGPFTQWVAYNPAGSRSVTAAGQVATLWDTTTGQAIGIASVPGTAASAAFRPDGTLRVVDQSGGVFSWDPSLEHDIEFACHAAGRDITPEEWQAAFPDLAYRKVCTA